MESTRIQKQTDTASPAAGKKAPFFAPAKVQPTVDTNAHDTQKTSTTTPSAASAASTTATQSADTFFKPSVATIQPGNNAGIYANQYFLKKAGNEAGATAQQATKPDHDGSGKQGVNAGMGVNVLTPGNTKSGLEPAVQNNPLQGVSSAMPHTDLNAPAAEQHTAPVTASSPAAAADTASHSTKTQDDNVQTGGALAGHMAIAGKNAPAANGAEAGASAVAAGSPYKHIRPEATEAVFKSKLHKAGKLAHTVAATKSAAEKIEESEKAEDTPPTESQALSNEGQVDALNNQKADPKTEDDAKATLDTAINNSVPATLEQMDDFKDSGKGEDISKAVMGHVNNDVADVKAGFIGIETPHPPAPAEKGVELPAPEEAEKVAPINMGAGVVPPIEKQEIDTKQYINQSENLLKQEEVTQEQLDMVDTGDLANANKERKKLQKEAVSQPAEVQHMALQEHKKVDSAMKVEESHGRSDMNEHRKQHLSVTGEKQLQAKRDLEAKRDEVARTINGRYKTCQDSILGKLNDLEKKSLTQFDSGQAQATKEFELQVDHDISAFKKKRYDRFGGSVLWLKDKIFGIEDFPEVVKAFDDARKDFTKKIDTLITTITKANNEVIAGCKKELADTKAGIATYVASLAPQLQDVGKKAQEEVNKKLKELGAEINRRKEKLQQKLADKRKAAMEAIDKKIEAMKASMSGALSIIGKLLLMAAMKFFKWALEAAGLSPDNIMGIIDKGVAVIKAIVTKPIAFVKNLINAAKTGFKHFGLNFLVHLKDAVFSWLTGSLEGVTLPKVWDVKGIFSLALDILGITYPVIRGKMVNLMGEPAVANLEKVFTLVKTLVTEGPIAAWEQLKEMADDIKETFIDAVKSWIQNTIIFKAIETIVEMFIPGAGIVKAVIGIYDTVMFFIQKAKDIAQMVGSFLGSVADIAAGKIDAGADALENGLATALTLVINFLAKFLHLDGITDKIRKAIETIRGKVSMVMDKIVLWIQKTAGKLLGKKDDKEDKKSEYAPEKQAKIDAAILDLRAEEQKYLVSDEIKQEDAQKVAETIKGRHKVFSSFTVVDDGEQWDYNYTASKGKKVGGHKKAGGAGVMDPSSAPVYGNAQPVSGFGTKVTAQRLIKDPYPGGSEADASWTTDIYTILNKRYKTKSSSFPYYKRGHLLSWRFGGPGNLGRNLTPLSSSGNGLHRTQVEAKLLEQLGKKTKGRYSAFTYTIKPVYGRTDVISIDAFSFKDNEASKRKTIKKILDAEKKHVPATLECTVKQIKNDDEATGFELTESIPNTIDSEVENYFVRKEDLIES